MQNTVFILWPEVDRFYANCLTHDEKLKQRIRRAFEKYEMEEPEFAEFAQLLFEKIRPVVTGMS